MTTAAAAERYLVEHIVENAHKGVARFNPHDKSLDDLPRIYAFSNVVGGGDGIAYAIAADGTGLGSHWCSHEGYVRCDLGVLEGTREDRHETYRKHYPDGYLMQFVPSSDVLTHPGLCAAIDLANKKPTESSSAA